jgi:hypothetical protein
MSPREVKFWYWVVDLLPKKILYFCVMKVWVDATMGQHKGKHPDDITWSMAVQTLGVE